MRARLLLCGCGCASPSPPSSTPQFLSNPSFAPAPTHHHRSVCLHIPTTKAPSIFPNTQHSRERRCGSSSGRTPDWASRHVSVGRRVRERALLPRGADAQGPVPRRAIRRGGVGQGQAGVRDVHERHVRQCLRPRRRLAGAHRVHAHARRPEGRHGRSGGGARLRPGYRHLPSPAVSFSSTTTTQPNPSLLPAPASTQPTIQFYVRSRFFSLARQALAIT